jgi:hypothetical protein
MLHDKNEKKKTLIISEHYQSVLLGGDLLTLA